MSKKYPNLIEAGLKVGDTVDSIYGETIVASIENGSGYPIRTQGNGRLYSFSDKGFNNINDAYPSIWFKSDTDWFNPPMSPPEPDHVKEFYTDRPVWVRGNNSALWVPRYAAMFLPFGRERFVVFEGGDKLSDARGLASWAQVSYTKPEGAEDHE